MNIRTAVKMLLRELRIDSTTSGSQAETDAKIQLIDAMDTCKGEEFWFSKSRTAFDTVSEQYRYDLPSDFLSLTSDVMLLSTATTPINRRKLLPATQNMVEELKFLGTEPDTSINSGTPTYYTIDDSTNQMLLLPIPYASNDRVEFEYAVDPGIPTYEYTGSAWAFYAPDSNVTLADTFSNVLLTHAFKAVFYRACYNLLTGPYSGTEAALVKSTEYIKKWLEAMSEIKSDGAKKGAGPAVRRHIS